MIKKKQDLHRLAEANRAYAHFRWWIVCMSVIAVCSCSSLYMQNDIKPCISAVKWKDWVMETMLNINMHPYWGGQGFKDIASLNIPSQEHSGNSISLGCMQHPNSVAQSGKNSTFGEQRQWDIAMSLGFVATLAQVACISAKTAAVQHSSQSLGSSGPSHKSSHPRV